MTTPPEDKATPLVIEDPAALLAAIVSSSNDAILSKTLDGTITSWNASTERLFGYTASEMIGASIRKLIPDDRQHEEDMILRRIASGERIENYETVRRRKDGACVDVSVTVSPVRDAEGRIVGASKIARDITERKEAERRIQVLMAEINHRTKNLLSLVSAVAHQTAARHTDDFLETFDHRLRALSANQDLLVENDWRGVDLGELARRQFAPFADAAGAQVRLTGPHLLLSSNAAQQIGMALHELVTNAVKHGALSTESGRIELEWTVGRGGFELVWTERGGPPATRPGQTGFGSKFLTALVAASVDGEAELLFPKEGAHWRLCCPLARVAADAELSRST